MHYISWHSVACLALLQADANHLLFHQFRLWFLNRRLKKNLSHWRLQMAIFQFADMQDGKRRHVVTQTRKDSSAPPCTSSLSLLSLHRRTCRIRDIAQNACESSPPMADRLSRFSQAPLVESSQPLHAILFSSVSLHHSRSWSHPYASTSTP
jgi:hypothetical protein